MEKDIFYARTHAILDNCYFYVVFDVINNSYAVGKNTVDKDLSWKKFRHGLHLVSNNSKHFQFNPSGAPGNSDSIKLEDKRNNTYTFSLVPATGKINLKSEKSW